ncbi:S-adenosyl-L-methionine-dependent methyltransferase [Sanghuangporus baumii]|uniref:S-adenosyl-L-methionine-dependent methyltransferase n=1 Tax=Sanghuangporus baumii TaxID=108892 RepID=A0A9Q5HVG2_SANBA|nr:S-adenosyl-L-methionine-dependent methyltransferase [Sanghuangporus baumii]
MSPTSFTTLSESGKVHPTSQAGFGQGKAELYDSVRPSYPPEALSNIRKLVAGKSGLNVVEIGCGSGKFTRVLLAHPEWEQSIKELKCIEPNEGMRAVFSKTVDDPRVSLSEGTFDATGVPDHWADLIVIATAFHWCQDLEAATEEFIRILKSDGVVCLIWITDDTDTVAWVQQAYEFCLPFLDDTPSSGEGRLQWIRIFSLPRYKENFSAPENDTIRFIEQRTIENALAFYMSWSGIAMLPDDKKGKVKEQVKTIIKQGDELVWVNEKEGILEMPFVTYLVTFRRGQGAGN